MFAVGLLTVLKSQRSCDRGVPHSRSIKSITFFAGFARVNIVGIF
jgi:hypothetical protein